MDAHVQWMSSVESISFFLAAFLTLWISGRIILRNDAGDNRAAQIFLWLALGGLLLTPLTDFLLFLSSVLSLIVPSLRDSSIIMVFLGVGPFLLYSTLTLVLGVVVYCLAFYCARRMVTQGKLPLIQGLQLGIWELGLVLLGIAGLVNHMVRGIVVSFVSINLPSLTAQQNLAQGLKGFWLSWLIALLILLVTLFIMNEQLKKE